MYNKLSNKIDLNREFSDAVFAWDTEKVKNLFAEGKESYPSINMDLVSGPAILMAAMNKKWEMFEVLYSLDADLNVKLINNDWHLIHECVKNAPLHITKGIIEYCELDVQTEDGKTPLMIAIRENNETVAKLLLESKTASVSISDKNGNNAGHYAAKFGMNNLFLELIKEGVPLNRQNNDGKYPADLIEDDFFKLSLPKIEENKINTPQKVKKELEIEQPAKPETASGLSGLSKIKKNFS